MYRNNLIAIVIFLVAIGLIIVFSSSILQGGEFGGSIVFFKQLLWVSLALLAMWLTAKIDYHRVIRFAPYILGIAAVLLLAVLVPGIGVHKHGAQRWIRSGPLGFQPSEVAKLAAVIFATWWLCRNRHRMKSLVWVFGVLMALAGGLAGLLLLEPDFGTAVLIIGVVT